VSVPAAPFSTIQQDEAPPVAPKMPLDLQGSLGMLDWALIDE